MVECLLLIKEKIFIKRDVIKSVSEFYNKGF